MSHNYWSAEQIAKREAFIENMTSLIRNSSRLVVGGLCFFVSEEETVGVGTFNIPHSPEHVKDIIRHGLEVLENPVAMDTMPVIHEKDVN